jgi:hypothetical protein
MKEGKDQRITFSLKPAKEGSFTKFDLRGGTSYLSSFRRNYTMR